MKYKLFRLPLTLTSLIGGVVFLASSAAYAGNEAYLDSSNSFAADENQTYEAFQYTVLSYHQDELDGAKPGTLVENHESLVYENLAVEETSVDDSPDSSSTPGTGIGMGVTPLFDNYGVIRASSSQDKSTYLALGFISDELKIDEDDSLDSEDKNAFAYGFGVNNSSSNFEYMMSVDQEINGVSAVGMKFTSEF